MNNLPTEILQQIFILLQQEDQLECLSTCSLWKNIIEEDCLFRTLHVYHYYLLGQASKRLCEQPRLGYNVHQLVLHFYDTEGDGLPIFLEKLPNLRKIRTYGLINSLIDRSNPAKCYWSKNIESIDECGTKSIVPHLLSNNVCPNLTFLSFFNMQYNVIPYLKNAPALEVLIMEKYTIDFESINKIHDSLPNLKSFKLINAAVCEDVIDNIIINEYGIDDNLKPANQISKISLKNLRAHNRGIMLQLLQFITKKYPNLLELEHKIDYSSRNDEDNNILYNRGWKPLIRDLGPQLKKIYTTCTAISPNLLPTLDEHNCQIQHLEIHYFLPDFTQSQQVLYIRTLILNNVRCGSFKWLKELQLLEELEIKIDVNTKPYRLNFNDLTLNCPPTLKSLTFRNITLIADLLSTSEYNVMDLSFFKCKLSEKIFRFVDRHFPLLANLKVNGCINLPKNIILRSAELQSFCYIDVAKKTPNYVMVRTVYDNEERCYFIGEKERCYPYVSILRESHDSDFAPVKSQPADKIKVKPDISLCCFSVKKVLVCR